MAQTTVALQSAWFALPWRIASRLVIGLGWVAVGRTQSTRALVVVVLAGVAVAVVQAVQQAHWIAAFVLGAVSLCAVLCPIADAAMGATKRIRSRPVRPCARTRTAAGERAEYSRRRATAAGKHRGPDAESLPVDYQPHDRPRRPRRTGVSHQSREPQRDVRDG